jgi:hypothetical protein
VFGLGPATRVYLAVGATDLRKGFEGLFGLVKDRLELGRARNGACKLLGRMRGANFLMQLNSIPKIRPPLGSWRSGSTFAIDAQAQAQKLTHSDRHLLQQQKARPLLEQIKGAIEVARAQALPSSEAFFVAGASKR